MIQVGWGLCTCVCVWKVIWDDFKSVVALRFWRRTSLWVKDFIPQFLFFPLGKMRSSCKQGCQGGYEVWAQDQKLSRFVSVATTIKYNIESVLTFGDREMVTYLDQKYFPTLSSLGFYFLEVASKYKNCPGKVKTSALWHVRANEMDLQILLPKGPFRVWVFASSPRELAPWGSRGCWLRVVWFCFSWLCDNQ